VSTNQDHQGWYLVVPSTDKRNKTFDHRHLEPASLSSDAIKDLLPPASAPTTQKGLDGWKIPKPANPEGIGLFLRAAIRLLTHGDWAALSNAAYRDMHDSPAAFDVFAGLYWGLRDRKSGGLPSRNVGWLTLKLMAAVPAHARVLHPRAKFCPLHAMPRRQPEERGRTSVYPVSFPRGERLESALRSVLDSNMGKRSPEPIDWIGLCHGLNQLLD
jgi:hypothetical protein